MSDWSWGEIDDLHHETCPTCGRWEPCRHCLEEPEEHQFDDDRRD